ncbi:hypothetical protein [Halorussus litoreus]|uniref:hypothetical protein n=1 Tax=Halorussus litoreus TaxID=1710536 RepID=UPI000E23AD64|nr:hypothetical protein [Halorussus litoreus]
MRRRPFLHLAAAAVATSGCLGTSEPVDDEPSATTGTTSTETTTGTATEETTSSTESTTESAESAGPLAVERVEAFDYAVRMNDLGQNPGGGAVQFDDLTDREQGIVERALDGGYETDDPPDWLLQFAEGTPVVARSGAYYQLDHDFPTTTVTAEAVSESEVDGEIADYEAYEAAVTHDGRVMSGLLRIAREKGMDFTHVWPSLREFLDEYAAVRYHGDVVSMSADVEDSGPPYGVSATEISVSEAVGGDVWQVAEADAEVRELVRAAGNASGAYGFDSAPAGLFEKLENHRYAYLDGAFYTTYVEATESAPVSLSAEVAGESGDGSSESGEGAGESGGKLRLALENDADSELEISTGAPRPFGVLHAAPVGESDENHLLWTDAYAESDHVHTEGREVEAINAIGLIVTLAPGETAGESFEVPTGEMASGEYVVDVSVGVEGGENGGDSSTARYRVVFSVE